MAMAETPARKLLWRGGIVQTVAGTGVGFDLDGVGHFLHDAWEFVKEKAAELAAFLPHLFAALAKKVDELFPPETRSDTLHRWLHIAVTVVLPIALGLLVLFCLCRCCYRCCRAGGRGRMMRAPGRGGARMPRGAFEGNPRQYFLDLRARKPLLY